MVYILSNKIVECFEPIRVCAHQGRLHFARIFMECYKNVPFLAMFAPFWFCSAKSYSVSEEMVSASIVFLFPFAAREI